MFDIDFDLHLFDKPDFTCLWLGLERLEIVNESYFDTIS